MTMSNSATKAFEAADTVLHALDRLARANWVLSDAHYALSRLDGDGIAEARGVVAAACATLAELLKSKAPPEPPASRL